MIELPHGIRIADTVVPQHVGSVQTALDDLGQGSDVGSGSAEPDFRLSDEQQKLLDVVADGHDAVVDATVGSGKALTNSSRIPTPLGWRLVGDIRVGDEVYTPEGKPTRVLGVFPQGKRDVYRVSFADGRSTLCSADHNWWVRRTVRRVREFEVFTTQQMLDKGVKRLEGRFDVYTFRIPTHRRIDSDPVEHVIHPYVVGAFLGNGCGTEQGLAISCPDSDIPEKIAALLSDDLGGDVTFRKRSDKNFTYDFRLNGERLHADDVLGNMAAELLTYSYDKRIPRQYLTGSVQQRQALVQGLMDTDGYINGLSDEHNHARYGVTFTSTSEMLARDLRDVLGSLGWTASMSFDRRTKKYASGVCVELIVNIPNDEKHLLFSLGAKYEKALAARDAPKRRDYSEVSITNIEPLGYQEEMTCFEVEDASHLFLADDFVVTHNTTTIQRLCTQEHAKGRHVLYLTYSRLLKQDALLRVRGAKVQNFHGIVYPHLLRAHIRCGISESIKMFNEHFKYLSKDFPVYDLLVIDEYQDLNEEYATLLENIKSLNPMMQIVMVGDMEQKVRSDTQLDVRKFVKRFCVDPVEVPFTQSFRMGTKMGEVLGKAWNKPVTGVNPEQQVKYLSFKEAIGRMGELDPGDVLALGARNGQLAGAVNFVEKRYPNKYNKETVYATIQDRDEQITYDDHTAVFTTFDGSKGMERPVCFVFGYTQDYWDHRLGYPDADPPVLRNVFLVAASRGKHEIIFVAPPEPDEQAAITSLKTHIGYMPIMRFRELPHMPRPVYEEPFMVSNMFDFRYAENVVECYDLLDVERLDDGSSPVIDIRRHDELIDLSPTVGNYQEAAFFADYNPERELSLLGPDVLMAYRDYLNDDPWHNSLVLTAAQTEHDRYIDQVSHGITEDQQQALMDRLAEHVDPADTTQVPLTMAGIARQSRNIATPIGFSGIADVAVDRTLYELKFTTELTYPMFLQLAMYLVMGEDTYDEGILWNTMTNERWRVRVPDARTFLHAVVSCVTKQQYRMFEFAT